MNKDFGEKKNSQIASLIRSANIIIHYSWFLISQNE